MKQAQKAGAIRRRLFQMLLLPVLVPAVLLGLTGCVSPDYQGIMVTERGESAATELSALRSFHVRADKIPAFLGPIIVSNFSVAMAEKGLQPVTSGGAAEVILRYEQDNLLQQPDADSFDEQMAQGGETRFVARIVAEVTASGGDTIVWRGSISRLHTVSPGEYMHTGRASVALLSAFRDMLESYPNIMPSEEAL